MVDHRSGPRHRSSTDLSACGKKARSKPFRSSDQKIPTLGLILVGLLGMFGQTSLEEPSAVLAAGSFDLSLQLPEFALLVLVHVSDLPRPFRLCTPDQTWTVHSLRQVHPAIQKVARLPQPGDQVSGVLRGVGVELERVMTVRDSR